MSRTILNKNKYRQFVDRCKNSEVKKIQVQKTRKKNQVAIRYAVTGLRGGRRANGEWTFNRNNKSAEEIDAEIEEVLAMMRKDFLVSKGLGFEKAQDSAEATAESSEAPKSE